jgi:hypothetical protein
MRRILVLALAFAHCAADAPPNILLRYQFQSGEELHYRTEYGQRLRLHNPKGQLGNLDLKSSYALDLFQKVLRGGPVAEIEATPRSVEVKIEGPMAKSAEQIQDMLRKVGFKIEIDARGRVRSLQEASGTPEALKKVVGALKSALRQMMPMLPEGPQRPGSHWRQQVPLPIDFPTGDKLQAMLTVDYVLRGFAQVQGRSCADIGMRLHVGLGGAMGQATGRVAVSGEGAGQGFAFLDLERGRIVQSGVTLYTRSQFHSAAVQIHQSSEVDVRMALRK